MFYFLQVRRRIAGREDRRAKRQSPPSWSSQGASPHSNWGSGRLRWPAALPTAEGRGAEPEPRGVGGAQSRSETGSRPHARLHQAITAGSQGQAISGEETGSERLSSRPQHQAGAGEKQTSTTALPEMRLQEDGRTTQGETLDSVPTLPPSARPPCSAGSQPWPPWVFLSLCS